jgi:hypothetical protein
MVYEGIEDRWTGGYRREMKYELHQHDRLCPEFIPCQRIAQARVDCYVYCTKAHLLLQGPMASQKWRTVADRWLLEDSRTRTAVTDGGCLSSNRGHEDAKHSWVWTMFHGTTSLFPRMKFGPWIGAGTTTTFWGLG